MANTVQRPDTRARGRGNGAMPVVLFFIAALALAMFAIGYLAWSGPQHLANNAIELKLPKAPSPAPMPNPQPIPAPLPKPG